MKKALGVKILLGSSLVVLAAGAVWAAKAEEKKTNKDDCTLPESVRKQVLARIGQVVITVGDFADEINRKSPYIRARYESLEQRKQLLDNIVRRELLAAEAARRGLDKDPDVLRTMKQVMIQKLLNKVYKERVESKGVTDEELKKFYQEHFNEYNRPEQVRISHILVKDRATAEKILKELKDAGGSMKVWRSLVRKYSEDRASKLRGGDLRYFDRNTTRIPKPIVEAAFKLTKPGEVAGPIKTDKGWHIIRLSHRRKAFKRPLEEVKDQIRNRILRKKRAEAIKAFVEELKKKANIKINEDELKTLKVDTTMPSYRPIRRPRLPTGPVPPPKRK